MSVFFTDLDNTLIYSHNRNITEEKMVVEYLNEREQSYMTKYSNSFFQSASWLQIIPVTTRTYAQFSRLTCIDNLSIEKAIICNGGMLLINGIEDEEWSVETMRLAADQLGDVDNAYKLLQEKYPAIVVHRPTPYMIYFKSEKPKQTNLKLQQLIDPDKISIWNDRRKVYLFAKCINKGDAVRRFKNRFEVENDIAAGDDLMDISMLNLCNYAFASERIAPMIINKNVFHLKGEILSNQICEQLHRLHIDGII